MNKLYILLTICTTLSWTLGKAQLNFDEVSYWVGNGQDSAVLVVDFNDGESVESYAWGINFNDSITGGQVLELVANHDKTFGVSKNSFLNAIYYQDQQGVGGTNDYYWGIYKGTSASSISISSTLSDSLGNGDWYGVTFTDFPAPDYIPQFLPTNPEAVIVPSTFDVSEVTYFVGEGNDTSYAVIDFNDYSQSDALVFGIIYDDSISGNMILGQLANHDHRFGIDAGNFLNDILFDIHEGVGGQNDFYWSTSDGTDLTNLNSNLGLGTFIEAGEYFAFNFSSYDPVTFETVYPLSDPIPATAPEAFTKNEIIEWYGQGTDTTYVVVDFNDLEKNDAYVFAVFHNDSITIDSALTIIANENSLFGVDKASFLNAIEYDEQQGVGGTNGYYWSTFTGVDFANYVSNDGLGTKLGNNEVIGLSFTSFKPITFDPFYIPSRPVAGQNGTEVTFDDIPYWYGEGKDSAIFIIDFNDEIKSEAIAFGVLFEDSLKANDLMDELSSLDTNVTIYRSPFIDSIQFGDKIIKGGVDGQYWGTFSKTASSNWVSNAGGDTYVKPKAYFGVSYTAYMSVSPFSPLFLPSVAVPGIVDTSGANGQVPVDKPLLGGVHQDSSAISTWATSVIVERGPIDIADPLGDKASFGEANNAVGKSTSVVSLGDGGHAVLAFSTAIKNVEGPDFAVFENSFQTGDGYFIELGFVEVSSDGENFVRFKAASQQDTSKQVGTNDALQPGNFTNLAGVHPSSFGTPFDLEELKDEAGIDVDNITHIKIVDVVGSIDELYASLDSADMPINDPYPTAFASGGFDLMGVATLNQISVGLPVEPVERSVLYPNPTASESVINIPEDILSVRIFSAHGIVVKSFYETSIIDVSDLSNGLYIAEIKTNKNQYVEQLIKK